MTAETSPWLTESSVQQFILRFPLPLALLDATGDIALLNDHFVQRFAPFVLDPDQLKSILAEPRKSWHPLRLSSRDGQQFEVTAQAVEIQNSILLVFVERQGQGATDELEHLHRRISELERMNSTDRLTGAWNRAHLERVIESELSRSSRSKQPVSLILIDIDHFKSVNDKFGHQVGDSVLCALVELIGAHIRTVDTLFRWGGEEFVVLTSATGYRSAAVLAEALRSKVEAHSFATVGSLTISLGVAEHIATESSEAWFGRVDDALYAAKHGGRNRVNIDRQGSSDLWAAEKGLAALSLNWLEAYECGEPTIDAEHRELFDLGNDLIFAAITAQGNLDSVKSALDKLLEYVIKHFADEEALLLQHGFAATETHAQGHARLITRAHELISAAEAGHTQLGEIVDFLVSDVIARHIFAGDRDFFHLFKSGSPGREPVPLNP
jgi:diguanylate cyclase (GGDEF)-like protein/hemerythrin-like metal-binding protein